jgi:hypothetical protein
MNQSTTTINEQAWVTISGSLVLGLVLLSLRNHALDLLLGQTALAVGDCDAV